MACQADCNGKLQSCLVLKQIGVSLHVQVQQDSAQCRVLLQGDSARVRALGGGSNISKVLLAQRRHSPCQHLQMTLVALQLSLVHNPTCSYKAQQCRDNYLAKPA